MGTFIEEPTAKDLNFYRKILRRYFRSFEVNNYVFDLWLFHSKMPKDFCKKREKGILCIKARFLSINNVRKQKRKEKNINELCSYMKRNKNFMFHTNSTRDYEEYLDCLDEDEKEILDLHILHNMSSGNIAKRMHGDNFNKKQYYYTAKKLDSILKKVKDANNL